MIVLIVLKPSALVCDMTFKVSIYADNDTSHSGDQSSHHMLHIPTVSSFITACYCIIEHLWVFLALGPCALFTPASIVRPVAIRAIRAFSMA